MSGITINCDMGEAFGIYRFGDDELLMPFVTHANIACGFHASDPVVMWKTVRAAKSHGLAIGAHPGLPDREGFGRRAMTVTREEVAAMTMYQTGALKAFLDAEGVPLSHIKPHGALMGLARRDPAVAHGLADAALHYGVPMVGYPYSVMAEVYAERGVEIIWEFVSDLDYDDKGCEIVTKVHAPVEPRVAAARVDRAVRESLTTSINGKDVKVLAQTICLHSDTPNAVDVARAVHETVARLN